MEQRFGQPTIHDEESVNSEQIYVEEVQMPPNRETAQVLLQYYKDKYAVLSEVCKNQQAKLEEMSRMQGADMIELQNGYYEARTEINALKQKHILQVQDMRKKLQRMQQYHQCELSELRDHYENRLSEAYHPGEETAKILQSDNQQKNQILQLTNMVEELQELNLKIEQDKASISSELNKARLEQQIQLERQRQELTLNLINISKTSATYEAQLIECKRQLNQSTDIHKLLQFEHTRLKQEKQAADRLASSLLIDNNKLKNQVSELREELEKQQKAMDEIIRRQDTSSYSHILEDSKVSEADLRQELSKLRNQYDAEMSILYRKEVELKEEREQRISKQQQLNKFKQETRELKNHCEALEAEVQKLKKSIGDKDRNIVSIQKEYSIVESTHKQEVQLLKDQVARLSETINYAEKSSQEDKNRLVEDISSLKNQVASKEQEIIRIKLELEHTKDILQQEKGMLSDIKKRYYDLQEQCFQDSKLEYRSNDRTKVLKETSPRLNNDSTVLSELKEENRCLLDKIHSMQEQHHRRLQQLSTDMQTAVDSIKERCQELRLELNKKNTEIYELKDALEGTQRMHNQQLQESKRQMQLAIDQSNKKAKIKHSEYEQLQRKYEGATKQIVELQNRLQHKQRELQQERYMVESISAEKDRLQKRVAFQALQLQMAHDRVHQSTSAVDESKLKISRIDEEQLQLKDQQIEQLKKERIFYQQQLDRTQAQLDLAKLQHLEHLSQEQKYQQHIEQLRKELSSQDTSLNILDLQKTVDQRIKINNIMEEEIRRCHEQIEELRREQHDKSMIRKDNHEQQADRVLALEREKLQLSRQLAQHKLQLSNASNKERFMELKLQDMMKEKEAAIIIGRHKRALEDELKNREDEIQSLNQQINSKDEQNDILRHEVHSKENVANHLRLKIVEHQKQIAITSEEINTQKHLNAKLQSEFTLKEAENKQLTSELYSRQQKIELLKQQNSHLQNSIKYEVQMTQGNRKDIDQLQDQIMEQQRELAFRQEKIMDLETVERHLGKVIADKQIKEEELIRIIDQKQDCIQSIEQELTQLKKENKNFRDECEQLKLSRVRADREAHGRHTNDKISNENLVRLKLEVETLTRELEKAKNLRQYQEQKMREHVQHIDMMKSEKIQIENRLAESEGRSRELDRRFSDEQTNNKRLRQEIKLIKEQTELQRGNHDKLMQQFEILKAKNLRQIEGLQSTVEDMNNKLKEQKKYYEDKNQQRLKEQQQYSRLTQDFNKLEAHCSSVEREMLGLTESYSLLQKDNQALVSEVKVLQDTNTRLENILDQRDSQTVIVEQKMASLNQEIERLRQENSTITFKDLGRTEENELLKEKEKLIELVDQLEKQNKHLRETAKTRNSSSAIRYADTRTSIESMHELQNLRSIIRTLENENKMLGILKSENMRLNSEVGRLIAQNHSQIEMIRKLQTDHRDPKHSYYLEIIHNLQLQIDKLNGRINSRQEHVQKTPLVITQAEYSKPEYIVSSPLDFGSIPAYHGQIVPNHTIAVHHDLRNWGQGIGATAVPVNSSYSQSINNSRNY